MCIRCSCNPRTPSACFTLKQVLAKGRHTCGKTEGALHPEVRARSSAQCTESGHLSTHDKGAAQHARNSHSSQGCQCTHLKECQATKIAQVVPAALCEEEVVVHGCQALPGNQVQVILILVAEAQLGHHCCIERGVLLVEPACSILLHQTPCSRRDGMPAGPTDCAVLIAPRQSSLNTGGTATGDTSQVDCKEHMSI